MAFPHHLPSGLILEFEFSQLGAKVGRRVGIFTPQCIVEQQAKALAEAHLIPCFQLSAQVDQGCQLGALLEPLEPVLLRVQLPEQADPSLDLQQGRLHIFPQQVLLGERFDLVARDERPVLLGDQPVVLIAREGLEQIEDAQVVIGIGDGARVVLQRHQRDASMVILQRLLPQGGAGIAVQLESFVPAVLAAVVLHLPLVVVEQRIVPVWEMTVRAAGHLHLEQADVDAKLKNRPSVSALDAANLEGRIVVIRPGREDGGDIVAHGGCARAVPVGEDETEFPGTRRGCFRRQRVNILKLTLAVLPAADDRIPCVCGQGVLVGRSRKHNIILVGFMGTGKSSIGRMLGLRLRRQYFDTDHWVEDRAGMSIPELFAAKGEAAFRDLETDAARELSHLSNCVISTGGGILGRDENVEILREGGVLICLKARPEVILARTAPWESRPLLRDAPDPKARIEEMLAERAPRYALADWTIDSSELTKHQVVNKICAELPSLYRAIATKS